MFSSGREGGSVTRLSEASYRFTHEGTRDSEELTISSVEREAVEGPTEDIEFLTGDTEDSEYVVLVCPRVDEVFELVLVEPESFDNMVNDAAFTVVIVIDNAFEGASVRCERGSLDDDRTSIFRNFSAAYLFDIGIFCFNFFAHTHIIT